MSAVVVEFFGLPGSGKTTTSKEVVASLKRSGFGIYDRRDVRTWLRALPKYQKVAFVLQDVLTFLPLATKAMAFSWSVRSRRFRRLRRAFLSATHAVYIRKFSRRAEDGLLILDEWGVQSFWSIGVFGKRRGAKLFEVIVRGYCQAIHCDMLVFLDIDVDAAAARINDRCGENTIFDRHETEWVRTQLKGPAELMQSLARVLEEAGSPPLIRVDAALGGPDVAQEIVRILSAKCLLTKPGRDGSAAIA